MQEAPNLTLNVTNAIQSPLATWAFAILGVAIQVTVFVIASLVTYHWKLAANGYLIVRYGYHLFLIGTLPLFVIYTWLLTILPASARFSCVSVSFYVLVGGKFLLPFLHLL